MIELTWGTIRAEAFQKALGKLASSPDLEFKTAYTVSRILAKVKSELDVSDEMYKKLITKHAEVDEAKGTYAVKEENLEVWKKEVTEFQETKFTIDKNKIHISSFEKAKLTPAEIMVIDSLIHDLQLVSEIKE
jgi:hypothetical protein